MTLPEVLHALVNQLPADWNLAELHQAVDDHFDAPKAAKHEKASSEPKA